MRIVREQTSTGAWDTYYVAGYRRTGKRSGWVSLLADGSTPVIARRALRALRSWEIVK